MSWYVVCRLPPRPQGSGYPPCTADENLNGEYVTLEHTGDTSLSLGGWTIEDDASHGFTIPDGTQLAPGEQVTIYTGTGSDTDSELYWGSGKPIWNNGGDTIIVREGDGDVVLRRPY